MKGTTIEDLVNREMVKHGLQKAGGKRQKRRMNRKIMTGLVVLFVSAMVATAGIVNWYAQISPTIDVQGVIYIDGEEFPAIVDVVNTTVGSTVIISHTIENIHDALTYNLSFNFENNATTGLIVSIWYLGSEASFVEVAPETLITFSIHYEVLPNADPREAYTCDPIIIEFNNAY